jgi:hypothetical protein
MTRERCIKMISDCKKRDLFVETYWRTPEEYFEEYSSKEPEIWWNVLNDLRIDYSSEMDDPGIIASMF